MIDLVLIYLAEIKEKTVNVLVCFDVLQKQKVFLSSCDIIGQLSVNVMKNTVHTINIMSSEITSNK